MTLEHTENAKEASPDAKASGPLAYATFSVAPEELRFMALNKADLPEELDGFELLRESELDNETMAKLGFGQRTADSLRELGRVTGYVREFVVPQGAPTLREEPAEIVMAATVVHLFDKAEAVAHWIDEVFVRDFRDHVGQEAESGQKLTGAEVLDATGFHDHAAALLAIHEVTDSVLASTIVDFRVGCLLGVAYVVAKRDVTLLDLTQQLALALERQMVRVVLGAA
jgi:hypothetical protein